MKFMKSIVTAVAVSAAFGLGGAQAAEITLKLGHTGNEENIMHKAVLHFGEELLKLTNGRIETKVYPNESLGKEMDIINGMQLGTADMLITGESLQNWAPMAALIAVPYAYTSLDQMLEVANGPIGKKMEQQIIEKAGVRFVGKFLRGPRLLTSNRPIKSPDELQGLKLRVPNVPLFVATWRALGANPVPMAFSEVFTSLQNGTIEAQENPMALIKSASFAEVQRYVNLTNHVLSYSPVAISEKTYQSLSKEDQQAVMEAGKRMEKFQYELFYKDQKQLRSDLEKAGMTFVEADVAAFKEKAKPAVIASVPEAIRPVVEKLFAE